MALEVRLSWVYIATTNMYSFDIHLWKHYTPEKLPTAIALPEELKWIIRRYWTNTNTYSNTSSSIIKYGNINYHPGPRE